MALDNAVNFGKVTVLAGHTAGDTSIALQTGNGALLPVAPFNVTWWNSAAFTDPSDDPNKEIVRVTAGGGGGGGDTLTVTRGVEGTAASSKNTAGGVYKMDACLTAKTVNNEIAGKTPLILPQVTLSVANGQNDNVAIPTSNGNPASWLFISAPTGVFSITGFVGGVAGQVLIVWNSTGNAMTIKNQNAGSSAANRLYTNTGADVTVGSTHGGAVVFVYDGNNSLWVLVATQGT